MDSKNERLEAVGRAIQEGGPEDIIAREVKYPPIDPEKVLEIANDTLADQSFDSLSLEAMFVHGSRLKNCSFRDISVRHSASLGGGKKHSTFQDCVFDGSKFTDLALGRARFIGCSFRDVRILELRSSATDLIDCIFTGEIRKAVINGAADERKWWRRQNRIRGNDFSGARLVHTAFRRGVDLSRQNLPLDESHFVVADLATAIPSARSAIQSWTEEEHKRLASILLDSMAHDLAHGQRQHWFEVPDSGEFRAPALKLKDLLHQMSN